MIITEISNKIGVSASYLTTLLVFVDKYYKTYTIRKKSGKRRLISSPNYEIKAIQSWILREFLDKVPISPRAIGFVKNKNIKTNATLHCKQKYILCLDLEDFFPSISEEMIFTSLKRYFPEEDAKFFTRMATFKGSLPQGGVTSPSISNIVFSPLDEIITTICQQNNINYTRYADDLTFSGNFLPDLKDIQEKVAAILLEYGFRINQSKTRIMTGKGRKLVTGLLLNSNFPTVGRDRKRKIRAALFNYKIKKDATVNLNEIAGLVAFVKDIEPAYSKTLENYIRKLDLKKRILFEP